MTETVTSLATDGEPALTPREWPESARVRHSRLQVIKV
jgi:hypothetical protein